MLRAAKNAAVLTFEHSKKTGLCLPYTVTEDIALSLYCDYISPEFPAS